jgi:hypothetical protein
MSADNTFNPPCTNSNYLLSKWLIGVSSLNGQLNKACVLRGQRVVLYSTKIIPWMECAYYAARDVKLHAPDAKGTPS